MASQAEHHNVNVNMAFQQDHYCLQHDAKIGVTQKTSALALITSRASSLMLVVSVRCRLSDRTQP